MRIYIWFDSVLFVSALKILMLKDSSPGEVCLLGKMLYFRSPLSLSLFKVLYANEGESKNPQEKNEQEQVEDARGFSIQFKDHQFCIMHYHTPTNCEFCPKTMWNMIKPPPALECRRRYFVGFEAVHVLSPQVSH